MTVVRGGLCACVMLCLLPRLIAAQQTAPDPPPAPGVAPQATVFDLHTETTEDHAGVDLERVTAEDEASLSFFDGWSLSGNSKWTDARGFRSSPLRGSATTTSVALSPSWLALGPTWDFNLRASKTGPGGLRFNARAGGTSGGRLPLFASDFLSGDGPAGPAFEALDPATRGTIWSAGVAVDRVFELGPVDVSVFGEALFISGRAPGEAGGQPPPGVQFDTPIRLTTGVGVKF